MAVPDAEMLDYVKNYLSDRPVEVGTPSNNDPITDSEYLAELRSYLND